MGRLDLPQRAGGHRGWSHSEGCLPKAFLKDSQVLGTGLTAQAMGKVLWLGKFLWLEMRRLALGSEAWAHYAGRASLPASSSW